MKIVSIFWCYRKNKIEKMIHLKNLTYLASIEVYYHCYIIFEHFIHRSYFYCLYDRYQGCFLGQQGKDYCIVNRTFNHYTLEQLEKLKFDFFEL